MPKVCFKNEHSEGEQMVKLLIIADDFTGALDTGVQFAARGAATRVVTDLAYDFAGADAEVLADLVPNEPLKPVGGVEHEGAEVVLLVAERGQCIRIYTGTE